MGNVLDGTVVYYSPDLKSHEAVTASILGELFHSLVYLPILPPESPAACSWQPCQLLEPFSAHRLLVAGMR